MAADEADRQDGTGGAPLTRRVVTTGFAALAGACAAEPALGQGSQPARPPQRPAPPPGPAIVPGQAFAVPAGAAPGTRVGVLATTGPAPQGFAITGGDPASRFAISPLGEISLAPGGPAAPGSATLTVQARGAAGAGAAQRVAIAIAAPPAHRAIAGLAIEGTGAPAGTVTRFAMPFAEGDLPRGTLPGVLAGEVPLRAQAAVLKQHPDGSARHVVFAVEQPGALPEGRLLEARIVLGGAHPDPGPDLDMAALLAGRQAEVTITPLRGGAPWRFDLIRNLPAARWLRGPLVTEARVQAVVPGAAVGGATSLRLFADLTLYKDGALTIDLALRNDVAFVRTGGTARYALSLRQDGRTLLEIPEVTHAMYATLMRVRLPATLPGGAAAPERPHPRFDLDYLTGRARIAAPFDRRLGLGPNVEAEFRARMARPDWSAHPFPSRWMSYGMGAAGVREDMGPITRAQACWLADGRRTFAAYALDQAEASAGCPWNIWDPTGGPGRSGAWINLLDRPGVWADGRHRDFFPGIEEGTTPWGPTSSHMPSCHFIPYVLTGKRALLDALLGQASWAVANFTPGEGHRGTGWDVATGEGMIVNRGAQWRTHGWVYREALNAAFICPPSEEPQPGYFDAIARGNMAFFNRRIPAYEAASGELFGHFREAYGIGTANDVYSYHTEYMLSSLIKAAWFGVPGAREYLRWSLNWHAGRFLQAPVFHPTTFVRLAIVFRHFNVRSWEQLEAMQNPTLGPLPVANWNLSGEANFDCLPFIAMNIACLVDLFPEDARVARAWRWFQRHNVPDVPAMTQQALTTAYSQRSVVPAGRTRAAAAPAVPPGQVLRVPEDLAPGAPVGVLRTTGGLATGYAIAGGTSPGVFEVDDAGVVTLADVLSHAEAARHVLSVTAANAQGRSAAVAVVVEVARADLRPPAIAAPAPLAIAANARTGFVIGSLALSGSPAKLTLEQGDREGRFALDAFGRISVAKPLGTLVGQRFELGVLARNGAGQARAVVAVQVIPPQAAPRLEEARLDVVEGAAPGTVLGQVPNRGGPARFTLAAGGDGRFALAEESGEVQVAAGFARAEAERFELQVAAENATGAARGRVLLTVLPASYVHRGHGLQHAAALGLRRLRENYAGALVRARRASDGAELDIGAAGPEGRLDMRALIGFARGGVTEVAAWYDQSPVPTDWTPPDPALRPLLTGPDGLPFALGGAAGRPALRFRDNRGLLSPRLALAGPRNFAILMVWQMERRAGAPILLGFHGDVAGTGDSPRLRLRPDGRPSLEQYGNIGTIVAAEPVPERRPIVLGVAYRGFERPNQLWWVNGATQHAPSGGLSWEFGRVSVGRLGHNGPAHPTGWHLDGLIAEMFVTEGAGVEATMLDTMGRALAADFGI